MRAVLEVALDNENRNVSSTAKYNREEDVYFRIFTAMESSFSLAEAMISKEMSSNALEFD